MGILFTIVTFGIVVSGTLMLRATQQKTETNFRFHGQAAQFAGAGLTEALGWFRRQASQPVTTFNPLRNTTVTPQILDTDDTDIGLVRDFEISGVVWGRYEVWKQWDTDPDATRLAWRRKMQVADVSSLRGATGSGTVWRLRSVGYVYRRVSPAVAFDVPPNSVLGTEVVEVELRRLTLAPPGSAAICSYSGSSCTTNSKVRVLGGSGAGIFYRTAGGPPVVAPGSVTGSPYLAPSTTYYGDVASVFGVTATELRSLADDRISSDAAFPSPIPSKTLYYAEVPTLNFTSARRLQGNAIVYVKGNVVIAQGSNSFFTGLLYVEGNVTINAPTEFNGTLIVTGSIALSGVSDFVNVSYDAASLNTLRTEIGQYRLCGPVHSFTSAE
jgi:hypothetical protein